MSNTPTHYTLNEYGPDWLEWSSMSVNEELMVFDSYESAQDMAKWMLEGGPESLMGDNQLPLVTILGHDGPPGQSFCTECKRTLDYDGECPDHPEAFVDDYAAYACGWVEWFGPGDVRVFDGDYENDEGLWDRMPAREVV